MTTHQKDENQSQGQPVGFAFISANHHILQFILKGTIYFAIFDASSPTCSFHSFLKDAAKAMDDTYFAITGSILGHWMLLAAFQMAQQSSTKEKKWEEVVLSYVMKTAERVSVL